MKRVSIVPIALCGAIACWSSSAGSADSAPAKKAAVPASQVAERAIHRRAVEAVIWGMPAVNYERMLQAAIDNGAKLEAARRRKDQRQMRTPIAVAVLAASTAAFAQAPRPVTVDNFVRAESDMYMGGLVKDSGGIGKFVHRREVASVDHQTVIRLNRDTLYSSALFDLDAGPVTITLPDAGQRFMSLQVISQDHYTPMVVYKPGPVALTRQNVGTRYVVAAVRTLVDPNDPEDVKKVHALQDAIKVNQKNPGKFEVPNWDPVSQKKVRDALLVLASTSEGFKGAFGPKGKVDPVARLMGAAAGWGGNPDKDATYLGVTPAKNDGTTVHKVTVKDVPVDAFWSISVYNEQGYYEKNEFNAYTINSITGKRDADGSITVQFGGCDGKIPNCIPIVKGWNYTVRLYRPRAEILNGKWKFPEAKPGVEVVK